MLWNLIYMWYSIVERRIKNINKNEVVSNFFEVYQFEVFICIFITKKLNKKKNSVFWSKRRDDCKF